MEKPKILIVEDDNDLAKALTLRLKANGFHPVRVSDTIQALRQLRLDPPDLILLDLGLPGGDGFTLMERLSFLPLDLPIVVVTARDPLDNQERAYRAGASAFLQKPVDNDALLATIRSLLAFSNKKPPAQEDRYVLGEHSLANRPTFEVISSRFAGQHN